MYGGVEPCTVCWIDIDGSCVCQIDDDVLLIRYQVAYTERDVILAVTFVENVIVRYLQRNGSRHAIRNLHLYIIALFVRFTKYVLFQQNIRYETVYLLTVVRLI